MAFGKSLSELSCGDPIMSFEHFTAFIVASAILLIIPGPTVLTVISYSLTHGRRANVPLVAAVALGDSTALTLSLFGLGALLAASAFWFAMVKWIGGLYLLWLGIRLMRADVSPAQTPEESLMPDSRLRLFVNTYLVTALNPKGILFFVAFLPQFVSPDGNATLQLWLLAGTFVMMATLNATMYAVFAASARKMLTSARARRCVHIAGGAILSTAGLWALLTGRLA
jgi:threonine/homoserine/homoserine lactone efflux protein